MAATFCSKKAEKLSAGQLSSARNLLKERRDFITPSTEAQDLSLGRGRERREEGGREGGRREGGRERKEEREKERRRERKKGRGRGYDS